MCVHTCIYLCVYTDMNTSVYIHISLVSNAGRNKITLHSWDFMWTRCLRDVTRCKDMAFWTSMSIQAALLWNSKSDLGDREDLMEIWKEIAVDWQLGSPSIGKQLDAAWVAQSDEPGTQSTAIVSTIFFLVLFGRTAKPRWSFRSLPAFVELQKSQQSLQQLLATPASDTKASSSLAALEQERAEIDSKAIWVCAPVT